MFFLFCFFPNLLTCISLSLCIFVNCFFLKFPFFYFLSSLSHELYFWESWVTPHKTWQKMFSLTSKTEKQSLEHTQKRKYHWCEEGWGIFSIYQKFFDLGEPHMEDKRYTKCNGGTYWCIWWISLISVPAFLQLWFLQENSIPVLDIHLDVIGLSKAAFSYRKLHPNKRITSVTKLNHW